MPAAARGEASVSAVHRSAIASSFEIGIHNATLAIVTASLRSTRQDSRDASAGMPRLSA
ncbi:hypothetical protein AB1K54_14345 [Microbacterium sp. BWT-B31]|uniref:hypothetical protein n=1 Tax=Microbacterium sp. BWT-B31 TaxID=3232072 RepID=UPI0035282B92